MVDAWTAILTGLFTGIGVETAKVIHELYIKDKLEKMDKILKKGPPRIEFEFGGGK